MKKKNNYFLDLHKELCELGELKNANGLCDEITEHTWAFEFLQPTWDDIKRMEKRGLCTTYWASEKKAWDSIELCDRKYNGLRQTIVLFCHEILNS